MNDSRRRVFWMVARALVGPAGLLALVLSPTGDGPRWQKSIDVLLASAALSASVLPRRHWRALQGVVAGAAALLLAVSGVVSGLSPEEGFGLITGAFLLSGLAWFLGVPERRAAEKRALETLAELRGVRLELASLASAATSVCRDKPHGGGQRSTRK